MDLAEPSPSNSRSPVSVNGNGVGSKSVSSARSTTGDSSTHYTQVDISRTDAIRLAATAAPSSAMHSTTGSHGSGAFSIPSVANNSSRATSSSASITANSPASTGNFRPALPMVSKSARGSD